MIGAVGHGGLSPAPAAGRCAALARTSLPIDPAAAAGAATRWRLSVCGQRAPRPTSASTATSCRSPRAAPAGVAGRASSSRSGTPTCKTCLPRATSICAHCGADRPPTVRWAEGLVCDTCYTATLRRRGICESCGEERRRVSPPGPGSTMCCDCAGLAPMPAHICEVCGREDKCYERSRLRPLCAFPPHRRADGRSGREHRARPPRRSRRDRLLGDASQSAELATSGSRGAAPRGDGCRDHGGDP